jgi:hypothetical protein
MLTLQRSTSIAVLLTAAVLTGCAKKDDAAVDTTAMSSSTATTTAPTPINLADVAGTWNMNSVPTTGDATPTTSVVVATGNTSGWTITFPGGKPIPMRITVDGDSIITDVGPYPSVRRKGVQVTTHGVMRLQSGSLVGSNTAHYKVKTADSVLVLNSTATRAQ